MTRYFFDIRAKASIEHDYNGQYLPSLEHAQQMAELIAMDLGCTRLDGSFRMEVQIRTATGTLLASTPVQLVDALAAQYRIQGDAAAFTWLLSHRFATADDQADSGTSAVAVLADHATIIQPMIQCHIDRCAATALANLLEFGARDDRPITGFDPGTGTICQVVGRAEHDGTQAYAQGLTSHIDEVQMAPD